jgi:hypothetical protein
VVDTADWVEGWADAGLGERDDSTPAGGSGVGDGGGVAGMAGLTKARATAQHHTGLS